MICIIVYFFVNCGFGGCVKYKFDFIYVVNLYLEFGEMIKIEDFWILEKEKYIFWGLGFFGEFVEIEVGSEYLKDSVYVEYGFN